MELTITANNTTLTDAIKKYAEKRLSILNRRFRDPVPVFLLIRKEQTRKEDERYIAEVTIRMKRGVIRGEMRGDTPYTAIDHWRRDPEVLARWGDVARDLGAAT